MCILCLQQVQIRIHLFGSALLTSENNTVQWDRRSRVMLQIIFLVMSTPKSSGGAAPRGLRDSRVGERKGFGVSNSLICLKIFSSRGVRISWISSLFFSAENLVEATIPRDVRSPSRRPAVKNHAIFLAVLPPPQTGHEEREATLHAASDSTCAQTPSRHENLQIYVVYAPNEVSGPYDQWVTPFSRALDSSLSP